jgi:hypothetical protein
MTETRDLNARELSLADKADIAVALVCTHILVGAAGWILHERHVAQKLRAAMPAAHIVRVSPAPTAALTQWSCTKQEFAEYREACMRRAASALTKPRS